MAYKPTTIKFSSDYQENIRLNNYINELVKTDNEIDRSQKLFLKSFIESCLPYLAANNIQAIYMLIDLALVTYRKNQIISDAKNLTGTDAKNLQHLSVVQEKLNKQLGLDAKSLAESKKNSLGDDILSIIKNSKYFDEKRIIGSIDAARILMIPIQNSRNIPQEGHVDMFDSMSDEKLNTFLDTAKQQ
jgi:hypothetical protein